jgi:hypothetical protein
MQKDYNGIERRQHKRVLFTPDRMIEGALALGDSPEETRLLKIADLSLGGLRFILPRRDAGTVAKNSIVHLHEIKGELKVVFEKPVELNVRWVMDEAAFQFVMIGCAFVALSASDADQLENVVNAELAKIQTAS